MRTAILLLVLASTSGQPSYRVTPENCEDRKDSHVLVRKDVVQTLNADGKKLVICEEHLGKAQVGLQKLDAHIGQIEDAVDVYKLRDKMMDDHVTRLETMIQRQSDYIAQLEANQPPEFSFARAWEEVDGVVGLSAGYVVGTAQCIGMAWVFNQPEFGGQ